MTHNNFVHLHVHSAYSLSQGAVVLKDLVKLAAKDRQPALALTDSGNLFGALEFSQAAKKSGIQPIVGCQLSYKMKMGDEEQSTSIVALALDKAGISNLFKLSTLGFEQGDPTDPFLNKEDLFRHSEGIYLLTGGPKGPINQMILKGEDKKAGELLSEFNQHFKGRLGVELVRHGLPDERSIESHLIRLADQLELPLVAANDCLFATPQMHQAQDALVCIGSSRVLADEHRERSPAAAWFKSAAEMRELFKDIPEACDNTIQIAKKCSVAVEPHKPVLPTSPKARSGKSEADTLREMAHEGLQKRLEEDKIPADQHAEYKERLDFELQVIIQMEFPGYFLIVADFIQWAKEHGIPVGPGRGSGAGSLVAYALTITDLNPLRFGLLFERFLNPERISMPDFDIDFCRHRREEVVKYVQEEYGRERVSQIITYGQLKARASVRAIGRVLAMPFGAVSRVAELIPNPPGGKDVPIGELVKSEPKLQELAKDEMVGRLIELSKQVQGLYSHASTHAAGVVIGDRPLVELVPLYRDPNSEMLATQYSMKYAEQAGLVKFDFLGLATLTIIKKACEFAAGLGIDIDINKISLFDEKTYAMMARADTVGVFQFESAGMRDTLKKMQVNRFEDLIAAVSLYRPGPMANIPDYCKRKQGEPWEPPHEMIRPILEETYGIMVYQEQVMQIAQVMAGYSLGGADMLRRAMGKKIASEMEQQRSIFVEGAKKKGVSEDDAQSVFDLMAKFAEYGFNKSHAAAYALVAYQTAWLKAHYPECLLAGSMSIERENSEKLAVFCQEVRRLNIPLLPVDINKSSADFTVENLEDGRIGIRFGLAAVKKVGLAAMRSLVEIRGNKPFKDITDLAERCNNGCLNKMSLENLIYAGALDGFGVPREDLIASVGMIVSRSQESAREASSGQAGLFADALPENTLRLKKGGKWTSFERLENEAKAIGFYLSAHPLDIYARMLKKMHVTPLSQLEKIADNLHGEETLSLAGCFISKREITTKRGSKMAWVNISDSSGSCEVTLFKEMLAKISDHLVLGQALWMRVTLKKQDDNLRLTVEDIRPLEEVAAEEAGCICIHLQTPEPLGRIKEILADQPAGQGKIVLYPPEIEAGEKVCINLPGAYPVTPRLVEELRRLDNITIEME